MKVQQRVTAGPASGGLVTQWATSWEIALHHTSRDGFFLLYIVVFLMEVAQSCRMLWVMHNPPPSTMGAAMLYIHHQPDGIALDFVYCTLF
jgi:hypothetical protein